MQRLSPDRGAEAAGLSELATAGSGQEQHPCLLPKGQTGGGVRTRDTFGSTEGA